MKRKTQVPPEVQAKLRKFQELTGEKIRNTMAIQKISQAEIMRKTGLSPMMVYNIVHGKSYSFESLIQILDICGMELTARRSDNSL